MKRIALLTMTTRVQQRTNKDCGVASLAMFLEIPYEEAFEMCPTRKTGLYLDEIEAAIKKRGIDIYEWLYRYCLVDDPIPMPQERSIVETTYPPGALGGHFVFMEADGTVLDPAPSRKGPRHIDQYEVVRTLSLQKNS